MPTPLLPGEVAEFPRRRRRRPFGRAAAWAAIVAAGVVLLWLVGRYA